MSQNPSFLKRNGIAGQKRFPSSPLDVLIFDFQHCVFSLKVFIDELLRLWPVKTKTLRKGTLLRNWDPKDFRPAKYETPLWIKDKSLQPMVRFKYLSSCPLPRLLSRNQYDLVSDQEFCTPDDRLPLLIVLSFGIFPSSNDSFGHLNYEDLEPLAGQWVCLIKKWYYTNREGDSMHYVYVTDELVRKLQSRTLKADWSWVNTLPKWLLK